MTEAQEKQALYPRPETPRLYGARKGKRTSETGGCRYGEYQAMANGQLLAVSIMAQA
jgi:hypothetical protein